ncbi:MAG: hypothetical protein ACXW3D_05560 [Caulobacteraceae bacterium]
MSAKIAHTTRSLGLAAALLASTCLTGAAWAADPLLITAPPAHSSVDANGVDLASGSLAVSTTDVVIGQPGAGGLVYARSYIGSGWRDNYTGVLTVSGSTYTASIGGSSESFTLSGGVYTSVQGQGSALAEDSANGHYIYTLRDGSQAVFASPVSTDTPWTGGGSGRLISLKKPDGETIKLTYETVPVCFYTGCGITKTARRVISVDNNYGYQLKLEYANHATSIDSADINAWSIPSKVTGINGAVDYCAPEAASCTLTGTWPSATYATPSDDANATTVTDALNRTTRFSYTGGRLTGLRRPSSSADNVTIGYDTNGYVSSVTRDGHTWSYTSTLNTTLATLSTSVRDPLTTYPATTRLVVADATSGLVTYDRDGLGHATTFTYDSSQRLKR